MSKPILYVHSTLIPMEGKYLKISKALDAHFSDIAQVIFRFEDGWVFDKKNGEPKVYLTDCALNYNTIQANLAKSLFKKIKEKHPETKVIAAKYMPLFSEYEEFEKKGLIDILLNADHLVGLSHNAKLNERIQTRNEKDIQTIRSALIS